VAEGWPPEVADGVLGAYAKFLVEPEPVLPTVEEITGVPARSFRDWTRDHARDFA